uniref:Polynucleotide adenylyltransferase n=1 Tax=Rhabditophanes sp. KR3021 TaxID=114890 RepID=A0AC35TFM3_9BILA
MAPNTSITNKIDSPTILGPTSIIADPSSSNQAFPRSSMHLNQKQVERLREVLSFNVQIHGKDNFPTITLELYKLIGCVRRKLLQNNVQLKHVKMNGGAASHVLAEEDFPYTDLDLIFPMKFTTNEDFDKVKRSVFEALIEMMPGSYNEKNTHPEMLKDIYINKMVKVCESNNIWSLFSLYNKYGKCIELKFVDKMERQFEFSVDSFQITLDPFLDCDNFAHITPVVTAESMYGDIDGALYHLNNHLIETRNPEEIRGGGLLKYCYLLSRGNISTEKCMGLEKYMCSRFFIDFPDIDSQKMKIYQYIDSHFNEHEDLNNVVQIYLEYLHDVIIQSTVCLMVNDHKNALKMVRETRNLLRRYTVSDLMSGNYYIYTPRTKLMYIPNEGNAKCWFEVPSVAVE